MKRIGITLVACAFLAATAPAQLPAPPAGHDTGIARHLERYTLSAGPVAIEGVTADSSGLAWSAESRTIFVAINGEAILAEISPADLRKDRQTVKPLRMIRLDGFEDTEGIAWMGGTRFGILEERRPNLVIADIPSNVTSVSYPDTLRYLVEPVDYGNVGIEGVGYDQAAKRFFIVKEKTPRRIYEVTLPADKDGKAGVKNPWDIEKDNFQLDDLSGLEFDAATGHLLILGDESKCVVETTTDGKEIGRLSLKKGSAGLDHDIVQPEGITLDDKGNIYICNEPNGLHVFSPPQKTSARWKPLKVTHRGLH